MEAAPFSIPIFTGNLIHYQKAKLAKSCKMLEIRSFYKKKYKL